MTAVSCSRPPPVFWALLPSAGCEVPRLSAAEEKFEVEKTDAEWRAQLTPQQYEILRQEGTERPWTSPLLKEHRKGIFACAGCDLPLFSSETKYESGTGWPSFWQPLENAVGKT